MLLGQPMGQGWYQLAELGLAFVLSASIGLEREVRQKSAGLRTYTLVGFSSALIMLVSKYGFTNILDSGRVVLDPSRIAAQIVSGIGFIGGGLIFVRKDIRKAGASCEPFSLFARNRSFQLAASKWSDGPHT
jgi:putative Mg2+ transporter-C (MgtC) family protein